MDNLVYAKAKNVRVSPRKARLITDLVRGKNAKEMSAKLAFLNKGAAIHVKKVIDSAISNAKHNNDANDTGLIVKEIRVDEGFTMKRGKAVSKGRYHKILRRNSHIIVGLGE